MVHRYFDASGAAYKEKRAKTARLALLRVLTVRAVEDGVNVDALARVSGVEKRKLYE